jgi:exodeoxyribonuclease VII small subunit
MKKKTEKTFDQAMIRLEEIILLLEENEEPLEHLLLLYKEGVELSILCAGRLQVMAREVEELQRTAEGYGTKPFVLEDPDER